MTEQSTGGGRAAEAAPRAARPEARRRMRRAAARGRRCERSAPAPGSRPPKGPRGPQWRKRTAAQGADGQAAVQCKRMGDPNVPVRMPGALPSAPEARGRYYRTFMGKGGLRLCPGKLPGLLWVCTRGFHCRMQCLAAVSGGASGLGRRAPAQHQPRGFAPARQPFRATGRLNGAPVGTGLIFRTPGGRSPLLLDTRTLLRHDP